jgi:hypothetical protein
MSYRTGTRNLQWGEIELSRISYILNLISTFLLLSLHGATAGGLLVTEGIIHSLFVLLYFFFLPLCCLFFFNMRILIVPLVSSNSSFRIIFDKILVKVQYLVQWCHLRLKNKYRWIRTNNDLQTAHEFNNTVNANSQS